MTTKARTAGAKRAAKAARAQMEAAGLVPPERRKDGTGYKRPTEDPRAVVGRRRCFHAGNRNPTRAEIIDAAREDDAPHWEAFRSGAFGDVKTDAARAMAKAGDLYAALRGQYDAVFLGKRLTAATGAYGDAYAGTGADPAPELVERLRAAHGAAHGLLCGAGMLAEAEVIRVCVRLDREPGPKLAPLRAGLAALVPHFRESGEL